MLSTYSSLCPVVLGRAASMASRRVDGGCDTSRPRGRRLGRSAGAARQRGTAGGTALLHAPDGHWACARHKGAAVRRSGRCTPPSATAAASRRVAARASSGASESSSRGSKWTVLTLGPRRVRRRPPQQQQPRAASQRAPGLNDVLGLCSHRGVESAALRRARRCASLQP